MPPQQMQPLKPLVPEKQNDGPHTVEGVRKEQVEGFPFLAGRCPNPHCRQEVNLSGEGRIVCQCGWQLVFKEAAAAAPA
jgi:hypothetical protein